MPTRYFVPAERAPGFIVADARVEAMFVLAPCAALDALFAAVSIEAREQNVLDELRPSSRTVGLQSGTTIALLSNGTSFNSLSCRVQRKAHGMSAAVYAQDDEGGWAAFPLDVWLARRTVVPASTSLQRVLRCEEDRADGRDPSSSRAVVAAC